MRPALLELVACGVLVAGGVALCGFGHLLGGFTAVGIGIVAALLTVMPRR